MKNFLYLLILLAVVSFRAAVTSRPRMLAAEVAAKAEKSNSTTVAGSKPTAVCLEPHKEPTWEWLPYGKKRKELLIGQIGGYGPYGALLTETAPINKAFGKLHRHDVVIVQGNAFRLPSEDESCESNNRRASFSKIVILQEALSRSYSKALILDTDAMIYDLGANISAILPESHLIAAQRVKIRDPAYRDVVNTWNINSGVTLWNLRHPNASGVIRQWHANAVECLTTELDCGDQRQLHRALQPISDNVLSLTEEFSYSHGTVIRHIIRRRNRKSWKDASESLSDRIERAKQYKTEVCERHRRACKSLNYTWYGDPEKGSGSVKPTQ